MKLVSQLFVIFLVFLNCFSSRAAGIDESINSVMEPISSAVARFIFFEANILGAQLPLIILWLVGAAFFFTVYLGFLNLTGFRHAFHLLRGDYDNDDHKGDVSHFQALATAVAGTVGIGNMGGIAIVITVGGPGAV